MKTAIRLICSAALLSSAFFVSSTMACTTDAWTSAEVGTTADDPNNGVPRVSGLCGLEVTGTGHVIDNSPTDEATFIGRFYVYPKLLTTGTHEIFVALSDQGNSNSDVFIISYNADAKEFVFDATAAGGGSTTVPADSTHWNLIEFAWVSTGQAGIWVNADALAVNATTTIAAGTGVINQVRMGAVSDVGGEIAYFDDYESHRSLAVGELLTGDGNADGSVNSGDIIAIINEFFQAGLSSGTPDCNLDGNVNSGDIICIINTFFAG